MVLKHNILLTIIFHIGDERMTKEEIEKEWQKELKKFVDYHSKKIEGMTEEENKYIKENRVNKKLQQLQQDFRKKYSTQK